MVFSRPLVPLAQSPQELKALLGGGRALDQTLQPQIHLSLLQILVQGYSWVWISYGSKFLLMVFPYGPSVTILQYPPPPPPFFDPLVGF